MNEIAGDGPCHEATDRAAAIAVLIDDLRTAGAARFDPVRFRYFEALARRAGQQRDAVRNIVTARLTAELTAHRDRFEQERIAARAAITRLTARRPDAADALEQLFRSGDFAAVRRGIATLETDRPRRSLAELVRHAEEISDPVAPSPGLGARVGAGDTVTPPGARTELKAIRYFRNTWAKLSADQQLAEAIAQAPENAGPLNSHFLVLRSLELMRDISPDYLNRFMSHVDALLCLDQEAEKSRPAVVSRAKRKKARAA